MPSPTWPPIRSFTTSAVPRYGTRPDLHIGHGGEQQRGEIHRRAVAAVTDRQAAGRSLRLCDHLAQRIGLERRRRREDERRLREIADGREILADIERHLHLHGGIDTHRAGRSDAEGVAIGRGLGDEVEADHGAGPGAVLDHHGLAESFFELRLDRTRRRVGRAARRERHDEVDRLARIGLRAGFRRRRRCYAKNKRR